MAKFTNFSRVKTQSQFNNLGRFFSSDRWLSQGNRYKNDVAKIIAKDLTVPVRPPVAKDLSDYIAASVPVHCIDGWSFFGKSLNAVIAGDKHTAKHLAYYAQLRALMSILASEGIGIFKNKHYEINNSGIPIVVPKGGTHSAVIEAVAEWESTAQAKDFFEDIIRPNGILLGDWFRAFSKYAGSSAPWSVSKWLDSWGYDIKKIENDQKARNYSSYRPTHFYKQSVMNPEEIRSILVDMWSYLEPTKNGGMAIDQFLLKKGLADYYKGIGGTGTTLTQKNVKDGLGELPLTLVERGILETFLLNSDECRLLVEADKKSTATDHEGLEVQMLCRAALLLRVASGVTTKMIEGAHYSQEDLSFWWESLSLDRGLIDVGSTDPFIEMWEEVSQALDSLKSSDTSLSMSDWQNKCSNDLRILSNGERVGFASLNI